MLLNGIQRCLEQYSTKEMELDELCQMVLTTTLEWSKGKYGYVACGTAIEPDKMKYTAMVNMDMYLKRRDIRLYKPNQTFFTPAHLRDRWILIPLNFRSKLYGVMGFENVSGQTNEEFKIWLAPFIQTVVTMLDGYMMTRYVTTQQDLFLSTMSHEIRTPLNGIVGMGRILKESSPLTDEQKSYINVVSECTYQLLELINDILDFSKMDCDQLELVSEPFDLRMCLEEVYDLVFLRVQEKKLNFWCNIREDVPTYWMGDKKRIRQIFLNLVNNAIKFTEKGQIEIYIYVENSILHAQVKDTGVGIPENQQESVFKSFRQVRTQKPNADGVGLGLAICKKLCKLMNGDIDIQSSKIGQGTCMHFHLPLSEAPEQFRSDKEKEISMEILRDKTVLLVDSKSSRRIQLLEQLVKLRMKPLACATYEEGLAYWHMSPTDLVIMEMSQPLSPPLSLPSPPSPPLSLPSPPLSLPSPPSPPSQSLPSPPSLPLINEIHDQKIPILSLSEFTNIHDLSQQILSMLRSSSTSTVTVQKRQQIFPMDILIVEDNPHNMTVICETLKKIGYVEKNIDKAVNGAEAIQKAVSKQHDIILMDLLLPTVDGLSAGAQILTFYRNKCPKHIRYAIDKYESLTPTIVALTAMVTSETQTRCKQAGFKGFLSKPINREELETMLAIISKRRQQSRKNLSQGDK